MCVQTVFFIPAGPSNLGMQTTLSENMEDDMERVSLAKELSSTTYPGRGIVIGRTKDGKKAVTAYFIMGRSENSRNRVFVEDGEGIRTQAFDPSKLEDPSLIIYAPVRVLGNKTIVTNGDQTDTIYELMDKQQTFEQALRTREFEPDAPNYTPRISGIMHIDNGEFNYAMSILKSNNGNPDACNRYTFAYSAPVAGEQSVVPKWINNVKLSGFGIVQYTYNGQENNESNFFNLRLARLALDGRAFDDWYWKAQIQFNGNTSTLGSSPKLVDLFIEWQKYDFLRVKAGQFKNPFTYENPMHPIDQGFMSYSQVISKFAGFSDRAGAHSSNGRDIGVQLQGDFLKNASGRNLIHYQVGVFNGQGINVKDVDHQKNIIGGAWVMPVEGMRLGAFGWIGSYARKGTSASEGITNTTLRRLQQRRYAFSAEYKVDDWTFRSEYVHSTGYAFAKAMVNTNDASAKDITLSSNGDKSQGVYALVIAPIIKKKCHAKARYDMYQPSKGAEKQRTQYEIGLDYYFNKNICLTGEYAYIHDRALADPNYSMIDVELSYRF